LAEKAKAQFLANMSHEIRTPMNGVLGMVDLLSRSELTTDQEEMVETINNCGKSLMTLLNDILDVSKIEAGKLKIENSNFKLSDCLNYVIDLMVIRAKEKNIELKLNSTIENGCFFLGDVTRIKQILVNLISNGIKFTEAGSVELSVKEYSQDNKNWVGFTVRDTGIGIEKSVQDKLFDEFTQADGSVTRKFGGTGLGLAICKQLVGLMQGEISLESEIGVGSTFIVNIPIEKVEDEDNLIEVNKQITKPFTSSREGKVLIVEDNKINQVVALKILGSLGHVSDIAENGKVALDMIRSNGIEAYQLILMDMQMPVLDGIEATKILIKEYGDQCPRIVAFTANAFEEDRRKCLEAGMSGYVTKPISVESIKKLFEEDI
jgi:CheY-like chemotaxis protein/two-component sensor histidine kinase